MQSVRTFENARNELANLRSELAEFEKTRQGPAGVGTRHRMGIACASRPNFCLSRRQALRENRRSDFITVGRWQRRIHPRPNALHQGEGGRQIYWRDRFYTA